MSGQVLPPFKARQQMHIHQRDSSRAGPLTDGWDRQDNEE